VSAQIGFHAEFAPLLLAIVPEEIAHNPGVEVRYHRGFQTAIFALFHADDVRPPVLVPQRRALVRGYSGGTLLR
jgi:hypothetical protein